MYDRNMNEPVKVKVTKLKGLGWGIRVYIRDKLWSESLVETRDQISKQIGSELRMIDKCGVDSLMASASRDRRYCNNKPF